jgi:hypothetical protein
MKLTFASGVAPGEIDRREVERKQIRLHLMLRYLFEEMLGDRPYQPKLMERTCANIYKTDRHCHRSFVIVTITMLIRYDLTTLSVTATQSESDDRFLLQPGG